jgi:hypothetical protein
VFVLVNQVGEAICVYGSVDLLSDRPFNQVAGVEDCHVLCKEAIGFGDLCGC